ncbi:MAG: hypothetical protein AAFX93_02410 [Verrucomicrobiota bacterium]
MTSIFFSPLNRENFQLIQCATQMLNEINKSGNPHTKIDILHHLNDLSKKHGSLKDCVLYDLIMGNPLKDEYQFFDYEGSESILNVIEFHFYTTCDLSGEVGSDEDYDYASFPIYKIA